MNNISFIISTLGNSNKLNAMINFLTNSLNDEVIVVDNSANNVLKGKYKNCITIWEKKSGLSNARNCGAHLAKNNLMFFLDDDLILPNDLFESLIDYRNIENELVGFKITPEFIPDYLPQKYWYLVGYKNLYTKKTVLKKDEYLGGCALLMSKKIYNDIGGFNSKFGHTRENMGANEDVLFQQQALKNKYTIIFEPKIDIIHCWNGSYESLLKRIEIQARNDYQLDRKSIKKYLKILKFLILKKIYKNQCSKLFYYKKYVAYINMYKSERKW